MRLLQEMGIGSLTPVQLHCDSMFAIHIAKIRSSMKELKHRDRLSFYKRQGAHLTILSSNSTTIG